MTKDNAHRSARDAAREKYNHACIGLDCDLCIGIEAGVDAAFAISGNYTSDAEQLPRQVIFANGRVVRIAQFGGVSYLEVEQTNEQ